MALNSVVMVKQVPDMNAVKIDRASGKPVLSSQNVVSSYDAYAIEEAIKLKEAHGGDVTVISLGAPGAKDVITRALAMGADKGVLLTVPDPNALDTLAVARVLASQLQSMTFDLLLAGQGSDDYEDNHVGPQVAELLGLPLVSNVNSVEVSDEGHHLTLQRDTEDGRQILDVDTPVLLTAISGLNEPRYPSLKGIMAAKKKPIEQVAAEVEPAGDRITWGEPVAPERTVTGMIVQGVPAPDAAKQLVGWLREQKLI